MHKRFYILLFIISIMLTSQLAALGDLVLDNPQRYDFEIIGDTLYLYVDGWNCERAFTDVDQYYQPTILQLKLDYVFYRDSLEFAAGKRKIVEIAPNDNWPAVFPYEDLDQYRYSRDEAYDRGISPNNNENIREYMIQYYGSEFSQVDGTEEYNVMMNAYYRFPFYVKKNFLYLIRAGVINTEETTSNISLVTIDEGDESSENPEDGTKTTKRMIRVATEYKSSMDYISVAPNPYIIDPENKATGAAWNDSRYMEMLSFNFLPEKCTINIFTVDGTLIRKIDLNSADGDLNDNDNVSRRRSVFGFNTIKDETLGSLPTENYNYFNTIVNTSTYFWDLTTDEGLDIAPGVYVYLIENNDTGDVKKGKFVIIR